MFFDSFPTVTYNFGNGDVEIADLFRQVKIVDRRFDSATPYQFYEIQDERPDQLSNKLYGDPNYHWSFFIINDTLKGGHKDWPLTSIELRDYIESKYPENQFAITMYRTEDQSYNQNSIHSKFIEGRTLRGIDSGAEATIIKRNPEINQLVIEYKTSTKFSNTEQILESSGTGIINTDRDLLPYSESTAYYMDSNGELFSNSENIRRPELSVTYRQSEEAINDNKRFIRVLRNSYIRDFAISFRKLING